MKNLEFNLKLMPRENIEENINKNEDAEMLKEKWLLEEMKEKIVKEKLLDIFSGPEKNRPRGQDSSMPKIEKLAPFVIHGTHLENFSSILEFGFNKEKRIKKDIIAGDFSEDKQRIYFNPSKIFIPANPKCSFLKERRECAKPTKIRLTPGK